MSALRWRRLPRMIVCLLVFFPGIGAAQVWNPVSSIGRAAVSALLEHEGVLYAAAWERVYRSTDSGMNWDPPRAVPPLTNPTNMTSLAAAGDAVFAGNMIDGVYRSLDQGATWTRFNDGLSGAALRVFTITVRGDSVYAGTDGAGVYVRDVAGTHPWHPFNHGLGWYSVNALTTFDDRLCAQISGFFFSRRVDAPAWDSTPWNEFDSQTDAKQLHAHGGRIFAGVPRGLLRWDGTAPKWESVNVAPASNRHGAAFASLGDTLLAVMQVSIGWHHIAASIDGGTQWTLRDESQGEVHALLAHHGTLWSGRTDGLWMRPLGAPAATEPVPETGGYVLDPPFPQPTSDAASITMHLPHAARVSLHVHDGLGRSVRTVLDGADVDPGVHRVVADLTGLPPGWYAIVLRAPDGVAQRLLLHR